VAPRGDPRDRRGALNGPQRAHDGDLAQELFAHGGELARAARGARHEVERAELEGFEHVLALRLARNDDHGRGLPRHQEPQEREAVHAGHLEVERDEVGREQRRDAQGLFAVGRLAYDLDVVGALQELGDRLPVQH
jgi:hypothetical protein